MKQYDRVFLSEPHLSGKEQKYINETLQRNAITSGGPGVLSFENGIESFLCEGNFVCATSSGTAAIHLALLLAGVQEGDEVICQSFTFSATINPIRYLGGIPIFIDSEPQTWNMCPIALEEAIIARLELGKKPKAILVVDVYGMPYQVDSINAIAKQYDIPVIEDSAEAFGSRFRGQPCGTFGNFGVFSFNGNKIITTSSGGALVVKDLESKKRAVYLATQAKIPAPHYQHEEIGYNYAMSTIAAAIGNSQLEVLNERIEARRANHFFYENLFENIDAVTVFSAPSELFYSTYWLTTILIDPIKAKGLTPNKMRLFLEDYNIETRPLWKPMHCQPVFEQYPYYGSRLSETLFQTGLCLPSSSSLSQEDKKRISEAIYVLFQ